MGKKRRKKETCLNCNKGLEPWMEFCPKCGQENHVKRASVKLLVHDFLQDYWTFDSKLFRSLKPLVFNPGYLTNEFIAGRRKKYIPPIRLYIFISFIFFFLTTTLDKFRSKEVSSEIVKSNYGPVYEDNLTQEQKDSVTIEYLYNLKDENPVLAMQYNGISKDSLHALFKTDKNQREALDLMLKTTNKDFGQKMQSNMSKYLPGLIFMLIPLLALIFRGLFYDRKKFYVDYLVFTLHTQSLYFLFVLTVYLLNLIYKIPHLQIAVMLLFFTHTLLAAKQVFTKTYTGTTLRLIGSLGIYLIALGIAFVLLSIFILFVIVT